jgi:hypothetical protein
LLVPDGGKPTLSEIGPDRGIDVRVDSGTRFDTIVQCKLRSSVEYIDAPAIREFAYVVMRERLQYGWLMTTGRISECMRREVGERIRFLTAPELIDWFRRCTDNEQRHIVKCTFTGAWNIQTCVHCCSKEDELHTKTTCRSRRNKMRPLFVQRA